MDVLKTSYQFYKAYLSQRVTGNCIEILGNKWYIWHSGIFSQMSTTSVASIIEDDGINLQVILTKCLEAFDVVLDRQLEPELTSKLSSLSPALQDQAKSVPVHNIHAERALLRWLCKCNSHPRGQPYRGLAWKKDKHIQEDLVECAIPDGARIREEALRFKEYLDKEERIRLAIQGNNEKKTNTSKLNKPVLQAIANKTTEDVIFRDLSSCQLQTVHALLVDDGEPRPPMYVVVLILRVIQMMILSRIKIKLIILLVKK